MSDAPEFTDSKSRTEGECLFWWDGEKWVPIPFCDHPCVCGPPPPPPDPEEEPSVLMVEPCVAFRDDPGRAIARIGHIQTRYHHEAVDAYAAHWCKSADPNDTEYGSQRSNVGGNLIPEPARPAFPRRGDIYLYGAIDQDVCLLGVGHVCHLRITIRQAKEFEKEICSSGTGE